MMYGGAGGSFVEPSEHVDGNVGDAVGIGRSGSGVSGGMSAKYDVSYAIVVSSISRKMMSKSRKSRWVFEGACPIPTKSRTMDRPSAAPCTACVQMIPKLKRSMRKNQKRKDLPECSSRGRENCHWTDSRQRNAQMVGESRKERVCSWYRRESSW